MSPVVPVCTVVLAAGAASAQLVNPFSETFDTDASNWRLNDLVSDATWVSSGGPDGSGYVSAVVDVDAAAFGFGIAVRGQDTFDSSADAFVGNWRTAGVTEFAFDIRHDAPQPLNAITRFATPFNFPAAIGLDFAPVLPNQWTTVTIAINPNSPNLVSFEGADFNTVFTNMGNLQLGLDIPDTLTGNGTMVTVDIDNVRIVPAGGALAIVPGMFVFAARRRR